jgi:hypothetical protein
MVNSDIAILLMQRISMSSPKHVECLQQANAISRLVGVGLIACKFKYVASIDAKNLNVDSGRINMGPRPLVLAFPETTFGDTRSKLFTTFENILDSRLSLLVTETAQSE